MSLPDWVFQSLAASSRAVFMLAAAKTLTLSAWAEKAALKKAMAIMQK
jgi:hypothetical protein